MADEADLVTERSDDTLEDGMDILDIPDGLKATVEENMETEENALPEEEKPLPKEEETVLPADEENPLPDEQTDQDKEPSSGTPVVQDDTGEAVVTKVEAGSSDAPESSEDKWGAGPIAITVNDEAEDGSLVPNTLLIYAGDIPHEDQEGQQATEVTNRGDPAIQEENTTGENDDNEDHVSAILLHLTQTTAVYRKPGEDVNKSNNKKDSKDAAFSCNLCDFVTDHKHDLKTHMLVHTKPTIKQYFKCEECNYVTPLKHNLKTHMKKHAKLQDLSENDIFRCDKCPYISAYKHDLQVHVMKHDNDKPFQCDECDFSSIYKHSLLHHVASKHKKERPFKCPECSYSSARKQDLTVHMGKHLPEKPFQCELCDYGTAFRQSFKAHMNRHLGNKTFKCDQPACDFSTTTRQNLRSHMARHKEPKMKHQCRYCDYSASHKSQVSNHEINEHSDDAKVIKEPKKFKCNSCDYETAHKYSMKRHEERHSENRTMPEKVFHCGQCGYQTGYKSSLKRHLAKHSDVKPFRCGHCEYSAVNMTQMHVHIAKHTGIKPFKCDQCDYSTANKQHLVGHMAKHSDVKLKCPVCDFSTAWKQRMTMHIKQHERARQMNMSHQHMLQQQRITQGHLIETQQEGSVVGLEDSVQQLYQIDNSETNEALSQLSNVIAAYQEQIQECSSSGPGSQTPAEAAAGEQTGNSDIPITDVGGNQQVLLIPNMDTSQAQDATVVIVDGDQINTQSQEQVGLNYLKYNMRVQFIIDQHKPILQKIITTNSQTTEDGSSTEIGININQVISTEQTFVPVEGEQILLADGEHTLMTEEEHGLVVNEKDGFCEQDLAGEVESMETDDKHGEDVTGDPVSERQVHVLQPCDQDHTLDTNIELQHCERTDEVIAVTSEST